MRILIISWEYPPYVVGGMGKHVAELLPFLAQQTVGGAPLEIDVLTTRFGGDAPVESPTPITTIYRVDTPPLNPLDLYNSVVENNNPLIEAGHRLAKSHDYDLIHIHDWLTGEAGIALKHAWKAPLITTIHATERGRHQGNLPDAINRQIDRMEWRTCYEAWRVIVCSRHMAGELQTHFGTPLDKIDIIPNGVDFTNVRRYTPAERLALRHKYAINGEKLLFFVGRIVHEKGLQVLLRAMPKVIAQYPDVRLLVAGRNSHDMQPLAAQLGVEKAVIFLGYISNEERDCLYQIADAAVFPSLYEPFGIVALEAMAQGCNVIVSNVGGLSEVVHHRENGLTVLPNDPDSIVWAVDELFSHPKEAQEWRLTANREISTLYRWTTIASQTVQVYRRAVEERRQTEW